MLILLFKLIPKADDSIDFISGYEDKLVFSEDFK
jgi:hypothetical protein